MPTLLRLDDNLSVDNAGRILRGLSAVLQKNRAGHLRQVPNKSESHYVYYSGRTSRWIVYEASDRYPGRMKLSFYDSCPCAAEE